MIFWSRTSKWRVFAGLGIALLMCTAVYAQALRDPTLPPPAVAPVEPGVEVKPVSVQSGTIAVMVRDGVPYLLVGTRLYAKGQKVGPARIERITETEVWLREEGALRKVQVFGGIERRASSAKEAVNHQSKAAHGVAGQIP